MPKCTKCHSEKSEDDFYFNRVQNRRSSWCKTCNKEAATRRAALRTPEEVRRINLKTRYGITLEDYNEMLEKQEGHCAICDSSKKLCVDHCHESLKVRGILCHKCNVLIAQMRELEGLRSAVAYLEAHE